MENESLSGLEGAVTSEHPNDASVYVESPVAVRSSMPVYERIMRVINGKEPGTKYTLARKMEMHEILGWPDFYEAPDTVPEILKGYSLIDLTALYFESRKEHRSHDLERGIKNVLLTSDFHGMDRSAGDNERYVESLDEPWKDNENFKSSFRFKTHIYSRLQGCKDDKIGSSAEENASGMINDDLLEIGKVLTSRTRWSRRAEEAGRIIGRFCSDKGTQILNDYEIDYLRSASEFIGRNKKYRDEDSNDLKKIKTRLDNLISFYCPETSEFDLGIDVDFDDDDVGDLDRGPVEMDVSPVVQEDDSQGVMLRRTATDLAVDDAFERLTSTGPVPVPEEVPGVGAKSVGGIAIIPEKESTEDILNKIRQKVRADAEEKRLHNIPHAVADEKPVDFSPGWLGIDGDTPSVITRAAEEVESKQRKAQLAEQQEALFKEFTDLDSEFYDDEVKAAEEWISHNCKRTAHILSNTPNRKKFLAKTSGESCDDLEDLTLTSDIVNEIRRAEATVKDEGGAGKIPEPNRFLYAEGHSSVESLLWSLHVSSPVLLFATLRGGYITQKYTEELIDRNIKIVSAECKIRDAFTEESMKSKLSSVCANLESLITHVCEANGLSEVMEFKGSVEYPLRFMEYGFKRLHDEFSTLFSDFPTIDLDGAISSTGQLWRNHAAIIYNLIKAGNGNSFRDKLLFVHKKCNGQDVLSKYMLGKIDAKEIEERMKHYESKSVWRRIKSIFVHDMKPEGGNGSTLLTPVPGRSASHVSVLPSCSPVLLQGPKAQKP